MTAKESVFKILKKQKKAEQSESVAKIRQKWLKAIATLFGIIQGWLQEAVDQNLLQVKSGQQNIQEERLGSYTVPTLTIVSPAGLAMQIMPRARFVVGANGRVDLECTPHKAILVLTENNSWQFAELAAPHGWRYRDLTEESFWEVLGEMIG